LKEETLNYFKNELSHFGGIWKPVLSFNSLGVKAFPYAKVYGTKEELVAVQPLFSGFDFIKTYVVQDSVKPSHYILQVMRKDVDKGKAVLDIIKSEVLSRPIIAAGNDLNDETLLSIADIKIVMANSPQILLDQADLIAPPVERMGIIPALKQAIKQVQAYDHP
jgi:hydroxymethylpyrimidine pyrophosphatase-like HAD family hydrolase